MVRGLIVGVVVLLSGGVGLPPKGDHPYMTRDQWLFVCDSLLDLGYAEVNCYLTPMPIVVDSEIVEDSADENTILYGFTYPGEDYIFVNPHYPEMWSTIIVHEATHYVLSQTYGLVSDIDYCKSEERARIVHHKYEGTEYDDSWRLGYGCFFKNNANGR